jgi:para-aminobenzoate synthetase / 4-amino-4-deoxychorismate lyase
VSARPALAPLQEALEFGPRPDPALGIFETMCVAGGEVALLNEHLARLTDSARTLYDVEPEFAPSQVRAAVPAGNARLRATFRPGSESEIDHGPIGADPVYQRIAPFLLPGGLGPHKWMDRRLLDAITARAGEGSLPLVLDADGSVLESTRMNVLIEENRRLISPPTDGRFRAGFGRTRLRYDEEPVDLDRLLAADAVVLTSALRVVRLPLRA